jgi:hypothetical protein
MQVQPRSVSTVSLMKRQTAQQRTGQAKVRTRTGRAPKHTVVREVVELARVALNQLAGQRRARANLCTKGSTQQENADDRNVSTQHNSAT